MKVKLLKAICCPHGSFQAGDEPDLDDATAKGVIDGGYAEELKAEVGESDGPESDNTAGDGTHDTDGSETVPKGRRKR